MQSKENKNIDHLFKGRLQGMDTPPPPVVWENIQVALGHKKRDRKVVPLWWKLGGVAAALVLLFGLSNLLFSDGPDALVDTDQFAVEEVTKKDQETDQVGTQENLSTGDTDNTILNDAIVKENTSVAEQNAKNSKEDVRLNNTPKVIKQQTTQANNYNNTVATTTGNQSLPNTSEITDNKISQEVTTTVATVGKNEKTNPDIKQDNSVPNAMLKEDKASVLKGTTATDVANEDTNKKKDAVTQALDPKETKESIFDAIAEQDEAVAKTDDDDLKGNRWSIAPNVAPVYYNSLNQGSSIDPAFADNTQNGEVNVSYGINVSYALSPRLTVRSGISNVNLSYATGGLELATGDASAALQSVTFNNTNGTVVTAVDQGALNNAPPGTPFASLTRKATDGDVFLTQSITYTEIPTELTYALVNKKLGVNLIGGFSTLFLGNNEVSVSANDFNEVLGEANNLSDVSFSTNIGLGLSYNLSKKFKFNFEPVFKYQLNPYTDTSVDFRPYYLGVYSGLSFKF